MTDLGRASTGSLREQARGGQGSPTRVVPVLTVVAGRPIDPASVEIAFRPAYAPIA